MAAASASATAAATAAEWKGPGPNPALIGKSTHLPRFTAIAGGTVVTIPIKGSAAGMKHFAIQDPHGISMTLPRAQPTHRFGNFKVRKQKQFRLLWVKKRRGALHLRLFFKPERSLSYRLVVKPGALQITVKE